MMKEESGIRELMGKDGACEEEGEGGEEGSGGKPKINQRVSCTCLEGLREKNVMLLKKLNSALFPVFYNDKYYADAISSGQFTKLAYYSDICVGAIACRLEKKDEGAVSVYIMTLGVLAPYRGLGIGTKLLTHVLDLCNNEPSIIDIYLHVQTNNDDAIEFYKKFGFEITETITNYYTKITPPDCYVVRKQILHTQQNR